MMLNRQNNNIEEIAQQGKTKFSGDIKKYIYDIIAGVIIVAIIAISLDAFGLIDFSDGDTFQNWCNFFLRWIPFFMAAILLNTDLYGKGGFVGKKSKKYNDIVDDYSAIVNSLTGEQIEKLDPFVEKYNTQALIDLRTDILKEQALTYERFVNDYVIKDQEFKAYINSTDEELVTRGFTKEQISAINKAKKATIVGISSNQLLSNLNIKDRTNIGKNEKELRTKHFWTSTIKYLIWTFVFSFIVAKDITDWGWAGAIIAIVKVAYVFAKSYMSYFAGYDDITINLAAHISRKTDILKMFLKYVPEKEEVVEVIQTQPTINNQQFLQKVDTNV